MKWKEALNILAARSVGGTSSRTVKLNIGNGWRSTMTTKTIPNKETLLIIKWFAYGGLAGYLLAGLIILLHNGVACLK